MSAGVGEDVREHWAKRNANGEVRGVDGLTLIADEWNCAAATAATSGAGGADRPSVLFLHGGGQNRYSWKNTCQILADEGLHVVALDSRGHGDSDRCPEANYSVDALCADTLAVIDQIGRPVILIGASMGGMTGILAADEAGPDKVTKLVLVDVVPRYEKDGSARIREFMASGLHGFKRSKRPPKRRRIPSAPDEAAQPRGPEEKPAAP